MRLLITLLLITSSYSSFSQDKSLLRRKYFQFKDASFEIGAVKILTPYIYDSRALSALDSVEIFLNHHPRICIEVSSHTDNRGNDNYNLKLSSARAQAFVDSLVNRGIHPNRLIAKGYGEALPIAPNELNGKDYPEGRQRNRRTEIKILSLDGYIESLDFRKHFEYSDTSFEVDEVKILCCIYFTFATAELRAELSVSIDSLIAFLNSHPRLNIEIGNNTDPHGTEEENQKLSQDRANAIVNYLIGKGIPDYRLQAKGYGETFPLYIINSDEGHPVNRRTEIKITSISPEPESLDRRKHFEYTDTSFEVGEVKILNGIEYNFEGTAPRPVPIPSLDSLANLLLRRPELHIEIGCHTDDRGNDNYNLKLTELRAESDYDYLTRKDIPYWRLAFKGYGETFPIAPNQINGKAYPEGQRTNNRTEVKIISISPPQKLLDSRKHFQYTDTSFEVGEVKIIHTIYWTFDSTEIRPESYPTLDSIVNFLYYHPELKIELSFHTDDRGNDHYNERLSQAQAQGVVNYLIAKGTSANCIVAKGYGESLPIAPNKFEDGKDNPEGRQLNRRTELKITSSEPQKNFLRLSLFNPNEQMIRFLFGEKASPLPLSFFNVRAIEMIIDSYKQIDSGFNSQYKKYARSYIGFTDAKGEGIVMVTINFSSGSQTRNPSVFNSDSFNKTQVLFINLSKRICLNSGK